MFSFFSSNVPEIDSSEVKKALDAKQDIILLDVRTPMEYEKTKINGSINFSIENITNQKAIESIMPNKNATIYVYCLSGSRSNAAVQRMIAYGYTNVFSMKNGLLAWRMKRYPLI